MSGELLRQPMTNVINGLEALGRGMGSDAAALFDRMRFDEAYRESVCRFIQEEDRRQLGERFTFFMDHRWSRAEMIGRLVGSQKHFSVLRQDIIDGLLPLQTPWNEGDFPGLEPSGSVTEGFKVAFYRSVTFATAMDEMERRGLVPFNTEDALCAGASLSHMEWSMGVAVLGASIQWQGHPHCLVFSRVMVGDKSMALHAIYDKFPAGTTFLAKRAR